MYFLKINNTITRTENIWAENMGTEGAIAPNFYNYSIG